MSRQLTIPPLVLANLENTADNLTQLLTNHFQAPTKVKVTSFYNVSSYFMVSFDVKTELGDFWESFETTLSKNSAKLNAKFWMKGVPKGFIWTPPVEVNRALESLMKTWEEFVLDVQRFCTAVVLLTETVFGATPQSPIKVSVSTESFSEDKGKFEVEITSGVRNFFGELLLKDWLVKAIEKKFGGKVSLGGDVTYIRCTEEDLEALESSLFLSEL